MDYTGRPIAAYWGDISQRLGPAHDQEQRIYTEILNCVNLKLTDLCVRSSSGSVKDWEADVWEKAGRRMGLDWRVDY